MCGFVGYNRASTVSSDVIKAMAQTILHRGPDDEDYYIDDDIALGFRRLSIIGLENGHQPLLNEDETKALVFNDEIYNYLELREELKRCGHQFSSDSDAEVVLHGYEEYGADLLQKLRGMFAFVIWDKTTKSFFAARDLFGIKPFY